MALYLGSNKVNIIIDNVVHYLNLPSTASILSSGLLTSDNYILTDINGLLISSKDGE